MVIRNQPLVLVRQHGTLPVGRPVPLEHQTFELLTRALEQGLAQLAGVDLTSEVCVHGQKRTMFMAT